MRRPRRRYNPRATLGFDVWRSDGRTAVKVNRRLIAAKTAGAIGASYALLDRTVKRGISYTYRLRSAGLDGGKTWLARRARSGR